MTTAGYIRSVNTDREGRVVDFKDIMHYRGIIKALAVTDRATGELVVVRIMEGGER